ncbi:MAG: SEC-C domain-containing protein [Chiayiivirga sp.]|nr:SEC-C domain-containing protein [Chiayiivirga sp.]
MVNDGPKVGRNDPCPCGSGKKFKHCHGWVAPGASGQLRLRRAGLAKRGLAVATRRPR